MKSENTPKNLIPFSWEEAQRRPDAVVTRDGRPVKELTLFATALVDYPVYGVLGGAIHKWGMDGCWQDVDEEDPQDLFLKPEAREVFTNVYGNMSGWASLESAKIGANYGALAILRLTYIGNEVKADIVHEYKNSDNA